ncbi:MAG: hypothetical protein QF793_01440 [Candidatus Peribacteraceae bacterium]|jgi:hypothetical protein|nr:hypothetical protein [Candidatus Peribacteraceae bacterium]
MLPVHKILRIPIGNLNLFERRIPLIERREYAQNQEDGIINAIFTMIGTTNTFFVEFGVENGIECNTRYLSKHKGWKGLLMDGGFENPDLNLQKEFITAENIEDLFAKYAVPKELDLLSIDIDGNDYWVWKAIERYSPRVVIMEYNACIPYSPAVTIPYDPSFSWDKTDYYGASLSALVKLGFEKGYTLVCTDRCGVNSFFVRNDALKGIKAHDPAKLYHPARFKWKSGDAGRHPKDPQNRPWIPIE